MRTLGIAGLILTNIFFIVVSNVAFSGWPPAMGRVASFGGRWWGTQQAS